MPKPNAVSKTVKVGNAIADKRSGQMAVPLNLKSLLSRDQLSSVQQMEHFGWHLAFVRRGNNEPEVVVQNGSEQSYALLEADGSINTSAAISVR